MSRMNVLTLFSLSDMLIVVDEAHIYLMIVAIAAFVDAPHAEAVHVLSAMADIKRY